VIDAGLAELATAGNAFTVRIELAPRASVD
jgi:hypothetical protein